MDEELLICEVKMRYLYNTSFYYKNLDKVAAGWREITWKFSYLHFIDSKYPNVKCVSFYSKRKIS